MNQHPEKEDQFLLSHIEDQFRRCESRDMPTQTGFLDLRQQSLAAAFCRSIGAKPLFCGGYDDAERRVCAFLPDYMDESAFDGIACVRVQTAAALPKPLTHRDYLGALMGMGIKRETVGDILVREDGADILVLSDMLAFLLSNFEQAGRARFTAQSIALSELIVPPVKTTIMRDTVPSLRLDCVLSSAFRLSRGNAGEYIDAGRVFVNGMQIIKRDAKLCEGDKLVIRGKGKAVLKSVGGLSKKERIFIESEVYE